MSTEFDFIAWISAQQKPSALVRLGIGDDLAVLNWARDDLLLVGVDQVLDGVHFDSISHSPREIGKKAMNRNLSDCAAMGCLPAAAVVTVALPKGVGDAYAKELFTGMQDAGEMFGAPIVGGDTSSWPGKLVVTVTILGRSDGVEPITRSGAKSGDGIYVTGPLGGSILGRHMTFEPRVHLARSLASNFKLHAMMDLSDGLGRDLKHICEQSGTGALLVLSKIPVHADCARLESAAEPVIHAISDGEDYELLVVSPDLLPPPCVLIGFMHQNSGLTLETKDGCVTMEWPTSGGWEHTF